MRACAAPWTNTRGKELTVLQEEVVTERNGASFSWSGRASRQRAGIVRQSASGATLFLEPAATVELNNDIVESKRSSAKDSRMLD